VDSEDDIVDHFFASLQVKPQCVEHGTSINDPRVIKAYVESRIRIRLDVQFGVGR